MFQYILIIFPLLFLSTFLLSAKGVFNGKPQDAMIFILFGLPIYTTALSISYTQGFELLTSILQPLKEVLVLITLGTIVLQMSTKPKWLIVDKLILSFLALAIVYSILPIGDYGILERLLALKSLAFFPLIYFIGRFINLNAIELNKLLSMVCLLTIAAAGVSLIESFSNTHLQTFTGYADFNADWFGQDVTGNYGLSWTFEIEKGKKRFASFFSNPLEHSAASILALSVIAALQTEDKNRIIMNRLGWVALFASLACIFLALSRASFLSYFGVIFLYSLITKRKEILALFYLAVALVIVYLLFFVEKDIREFVINTLQFTNESSIGHLIEWIDGLEAMISNPWGLGLGSSGRISALQKTNVGGENQFIIIGVQTGFIGLFLYLAIFITTVVQAIKWYPKLKGKEQKITLIVILAKIGLFIPLFTTNLEAYIYVSYMLWIFSGMFIQILEKNSLKA